RGPTGAADRGGRHRGGGRGGRRGAGAHVADRAHHQPRVLRPLGFDFPSPACNGLAALMIAVPASGGVIVGLMARYGAEAIRGHGIPEAMEQVLFNESRIPPRITFL